MAAGRVDQVSVALTLNTFVDEERKHMMKLSRIAPAMVASALWLGANLMLSSGSVKGQEIASNIGTCKNASYPGDLRSTCPVAPVNGQCTGDYHDTFYDGSKCDYTSGTQVCNNGTGSGTQTDTYGYCKTAYLSNGQAFCARGLPYKSTSQQVSGVKVCYYNS